MQLSTTEGAATGLGKHRAREVDHLSRFSLGVRGEPKRTVSPTFGNVAMAVSASPPRLLLCAFAILFCLDRSSAFSSSCSLPLAHVKRHYFCLREGSAAGALPVFHRAIRQRSSTVRSGARSELAMIVDKFFGNKASGKGKPQDVNKYGERFDQMLDSVQGYGEAEVRLPTHFCVHCSAVF